MRFVVLIFGFFGVLLLAFAGGTLVVLDVTLNSIPFEAPATLHAPMGVDSANSALFYFIAAGYGLLGVFMAFFRCGKQGAALMLIPTFGVAFMNPYFAIFGGLLALTGFLSLFVGPLPINAPKPAKNDDDDDD